MVKNGQKWPKLIWRIKSAITSASVNDTPVKLDNFAANSSLLSSKFSPKKEIYLVGTFNNYLRGPNFYPPPPLEWTIVVVLHNAYPLSRDRAWTFF